MNRLAVLALGAAAVLGATAGVVVATMNTVDRPAGSPPPAASGSPTSPKATPTPVQTNEPLLYASNQQIHDGNEVIDFSGPSNVYRITRLKDGYLIDESTSPQQPAYQLWSVTPQGVTRKIGLLNDPGDVNAEGTAVVGADERTGATEIWTLPAGTVVARWNQDTDAPSFSAFAGPDVLISQLFGQPSNALKQWDPATGKTTTAGQGFDQMVLSPGGSYLAGAVDSSGSSKDVNHCVHLQSTYLKKNSVAWDTCNWSFDVMTPTFSPDGTRLLVAPPGRSGDLPRHFAVIDASDGPSQLVGEFGAPTGAIGAEWADNAHLYVYGSHSAVPKASRVGTWIDRCDLDGSCHRLVSSEQLLTVGSSR